MNENNKRTPPKRRTRIERREYLLGIGEGLAAIVEDGDTPAVVREAVEAALETIIMQTTPDTLALMRGVWPSVVDELMAAPRR